MCGRYLFTKDAGPEVLQIIQEVDSRYGKGAWEPGEIKPTMRAPVLISENGGIHPELLSWGYQLPGSLVINARAESAAEKPLFRDSVVSKRCVIPSTGFYEWDDHKHKYLFTIPGERVLFMAGLYAARAEGTRYCILTTAANSSMKETHPRMPLVLERKQIGSWLEQPELSISFLAMTPPILEKASAEAQLSMW